jgi:hypothetical protein
LILPERLSKTEALELEAILTVILEKSSSQYSTTNMLASLADTSTKNAFEALVSLEKKGIAKKCCGGVIIVWAIVASPIQTKTPNSI